MAGSETPADDEAPDAGDAVRPIRALMRGLDALQELNRRAGVTVTDIAKAIGLPRTTAYRVLETLCAQGFAFRDAKDERYRLTDKVRTLADGFDDEPWINAVARPILSKQIKDAVWPVSLATLHGTSLRARALTTKDGGPGEDRGTLIARLDLLTTSAGRVFLANCGEEQRATLLDIFARSERDEDRLARDKSLLNRMLAEVRSNGWAICDDAASAEFDLAVAVMTRNRFLACLAMRVTRSAMATEQAVEKYVPLLKRVADEIGDAFETQPQPPSS